MESCFEPSSAYESRTAPAFKRRLLTVKSRDYWSSISIIWRLWGRWKIIRNFFIWNHFLGDIRFQIVKRNFLSMIFCLHLPFLCISFGNAFSFHILIHSLFAFLFYWQTDEWEERKIRAQNFGYLLQDIITLTSHSFIRSRY